METVTLRNAVTVALFMSISSVICSKKRQSFRFSNTGCTSFKRNTIIVVILSHYSSIPSYSNALKQHDKRIDERSARDEYKNSSCTLYVDLLKKQTNKQTNKLIITLQTRESITTIVLSPVSKVF